MICEYRLPKPISVNKIWRNADRTLASAEYRRWQREADAMVMATGPRPLIDDPVHVEILIGRKGIRANADIDNLIKCILDTMVRCDVLKADNIKIVKSVHSRLVEGFEGAIVRIVRIDAGADEKTM